MDNSKSFKNISNSLDELSDRISKDIDVVKLLDFSASKDDIDELFDQISMQPAIFAYVSNLKNIAESNYENYSTRLNDYESFKNKVVMEHLRMEGVAHPTSKLIHNKFVELFSKKDFVVKCKEQIKIWKKRKDTLATVLRAIESREQSFKSLSYMMDTMIKAGLFYPKQKKDRSI